eukprot:scaffold1338_cov63-Phaeocystis_antarctica.AAC.10
MQVSGKPSPSMFRMRTSNTPSNEATDAGIDTLKTPSTFVAICIEQGGGCQWGGCQWGGGPIGQVAQALARLAPAAPAEQEEHGQGDAYEGCQRRCRNVTALHARRLTRVKVPRAIGDVADSAVRPGGPWLAQHAICIRARRRVWRRCIGAAPQIGAAIVCAPVSRYQGKQSQSFPRLLAFGPDRAATTLDVFWVVDGIVVVLDTFASRHAGGSRFGDRVYDAGRAGTLVSLPREVVERVRGAADDKASRAPRTRWARFAFKGAFQAGLVRPGAMRARRWPCLHGAHVFAIATDRAGLARCLPLSALERARLAC